MVGKQTIHQRKTANDKYTEDVRVHIVNLRSLFSTPYFWRNFSKIFSKLDGNGSENSMRSPVVG